MYQCDRDPESVTLLQIVVCFVFCGESRGCRLFTTASMLGAVRKAGTEIPRVWSLLECFTSSQGPLLFLIIQWRWQRHLTWSSSHDVN